MGVAREEHVTRGFVCGSQSREKGIRHSHVSCRGRKALVCGALPGRKSETSQVSSGSCCDASLAGPGKPLSEYPPPPLQGVLRSPSLRVVTAPPPREEGE